MKCKRCGFVLEEGQKFCNMCGAEQSKIKVTKRTEVRSIIGFIKFSSKNHRRMWVNFLISLLFMVYIIFFDEYGGMLDRDYYVMLLLGLFMLYLIIQLYIGYKNPESTYTKRYRYVLRFSIAIYIGLLVYLFFFNNDLTNSLKLFRRLLGIKVGGFN